MRPLIDAIGTIGGGLAGGAEGMRLGHPVIGTLLGAGAGTLAAHEARKLTQRAIQKRYLTRRVIEQANKAPLSTQIKQLRYLPAGVVTGTEQIVQAPGQGPTLSLDRSPAVEPR